MKRFSRLLALIAALEAASLVTLACAFACDAAKAEPKQARHACHSPQNEKPNCPILKSLSEQAKLAVEKMQPVPAPAAPGFASVAVLRSSVRRERISAELEIPPPLLFRKQVLRL